MQFEPNTLSTTDLRVELARLNSEPITPTNAKRRADVVTELTKRAKV